MVLEHIFMLSLLICRIVFGELCNSFVHFLIRFPFYCWVLSFFFLITMNFPWIFFLLYGRCFQFSDTVLSSTALFKAILQPQLSKYKIPCLAQKLLFLFSHPLIYAHTYSQGHLQQEDICLSPSFLLPFGLQGLSSNCQPWQQVDGTSWFVKLDFRCLVSETPS